MNVTAADFRQHFELLSDEALLEIKRDELVELAQQCYDEEIERRGLSSGETPAEAAVESAPHEADRSQEMVLAATFLSGEELNLARGLLDDAGVPYHIVNPLAALGGVELRLMVPKALEEHALEILAFEISEEELAAQAEAAGMLEESEEEFSEPE